MKPHLPLSLCLLVLPLVSFGGCAIDRGPRDSRDSAREAEAEHEEEAHPQGAVRHYTRRLDADGTAPYDAVGRMIAQRDAMLAARPLSGVDALTNWQALGPGNIGGRILAILIHPTKPNTMWIGSAGGGVWKTTNGGSSWFPLDGVAPYMAISCMAMDPKNPDHIYVGTGEGGYFDTLQGSSNLAVPMGAGIYVTTNGGTTFSRLSSTQGNDWLAVNRIAVDPNNGNVVLAATTTGIFRSTNGGTSWTKTFSGSTIDVDFHPTSSSQCVAGQRDGFALYSTNGGVTWAKALGIPSSLRIEIAYAKSSPSTVYAAPTNTSERIQIYRSTDGGKSYTLRSSGQISSYSHYTGALWVDPTDPNHLIFGGVSLYKSSNGGTSFSSAGASNQYFVGLYYDMHTIVSHPQYNGTTNQIVFNGDDGGIHRTNNAKSTPPTWVGLNNKLRINQFYGAAMSPDGSRIVGGLQDQGSLLYTGNPEGWTKVLSGDGALCAWDPTNASVCYAQIYWIRIYRSTNSGSRFYSIGSRSNIRDAGSNFVPPIVLDPNNSNRLYFAGASLWRSDNARTASRPSWQEVKPRLNCPSEGWSSAHYAKDPPCNVCTIAVAKSNSNVVWVGHNNGLIYRSTNATSASPTWTQVSPKNMPKRWIGRIAIDEKDSNRVYVALMGYHDNNVWRTEDGGTSWVQITGSGSNKLPSAPVTSLALHRNIPGLIYAGTDAGVYWSTDDGETWNTNTQASTTAGVEELVWKDKDTLMIVTHGRGIYVADTVAVAGVRPVGTGCGIAAPPELSASSPSLGNTQLYAARAAAPSAPANLLLSPGAPAPLVLGNSCVLQPSLVNLLVVPGGSTSSSGTWTANLAIPNNTAFIGARLTGQLLVVALNGPVLGIGELSNGLEMRVGK